MANSPANRVPGESDSVLAGFGEFSFIKWLRHRLPPPGPDLYLGPGDDAAWWRSGKKGVLTTIDTLVEGVHFDLATATAADLGYKVLAVNLSDLAAMGGRPQNVFLSLALPPATPVGWLERFCDAFLELAARHRVELAGGDTVSARQMVITVTLNGTPVRPRPLTRAGARPGDWIYVSGTIGDSTLGLALLQGRLHPVATAEADYLRRSHLRPVPRLELGLALAGAELASAMIDISDGLLADLGHLLEASGNLGARLELSCQAAPFSPAAQRRLAAGQVDVAGLLTGGEDFELLFTVPVARFERVEELSGKLGIELTRIGRITDSPGVVLQLDGVPYQVPEKRGYDHFQSHTRRA